MMWFKVEPQQFIKVARSFSVRKYITKATCAKLTLYMVIFLSPSTGMLYE